MHNYFAWLALVGLAFLLIIVGMTGKLGSAMGALLTPAAMEDVPS